MCVNAFECSISYYFIFIVLNQQNLCIFIVNSYINYNCQDCQWMSNGLYPIAPNHFNMNFVSKYFTITYNYQYYYYLLIMSIYMSK